MSEEILNQAEIDSLLKLIGDDVPQEVWQPGELEAMEKLGLLIGEALAMRWRELGGSLEISPPTVDQCEVAETAASPALWVLGGLKGRVGGKLAVRLADPALAGFARVVLAGRGADEPLSADEGGQLAAALAPGLTALGEAMGELAGGPVSIEPSGHRWLGAGENVAIGDVLGTADPMVRFQFPSRIEGEPGVVEVLWGLNEARSLLAVLADTGSGGSRDAGTGAAAGVQEDREGAAGADFEELKPSTSGQGSRNIDLIMDVPLVLTVELGRTEKQIRDVLNLAPGSIIELERLAGEAIDVLVNGKLIARGEVVVVDDKFGVRVIDIVSRAERVQHLR